MFITGELGQFSFKTSIRLLTCKGNGDECQRVANELKKEAKTPSERNKVEIRFAEDEIEDLKLKSQSWLSPGPIEAVLLLYLNEETFGTSGLKWQRVGNEQPTGRALQNTALATALETGQLNFTTTERDNWASDQRSQEKAIDFELHGLQPGDYIKAGPYYFVPMQNDSVADILEQFLEQNAELKRPKTRETRKCSNITCPYFRISPDLGR